MGLFAMFKVTLGFKSGRTITFKCDKAEFTQTAGKVTAYQISGARDMDAFFFAPDEIESLKIQRLRS